MSFCFRKLAVVNPGAAALRSLFNLSRNELSLAARLGFVALLLVIVLWWPLFLCMPLWHDVTHYDICARNLLHGGVAYRDIGDLNLPGMVWAHAVVRSLFGWRSETLRLVDLAVVSLSVWLLVRWLGQLGLSTGARLGTAAVLLMAYLSTSEWCHCQRDTWMLLPSLVALTLRREQALALAGEEAPWRAVALRAVLEGLCWGAGFWIKPFVAVPALCCWLATAVLVVRNGPPRAGWRLLLDAAGLLAGGLAAGGLGMLWMVRSGAWPYFWDIMTTVNVNYHAISRTAGSGYRVDYLLRRLFPWGLVHLAAVPLAILVVGRLLTPAARAGSARPMPVYAGHLLLAAFYLGWLAQTTLLQMPHDYVLVPAALLAIAVVAGSGNSLWRTLAGKAALILFLGAALVVHPFAEPSRLALWPRCLTEGSSPDLRNRLSHSHSLANPDWVELAAVADFLRQQDLHDRELLCYDPTTCPLYTMLDVSPPTRAVHFHMIWLYPPGVPLLIDQLNASPLRFAVIDLRYSHVPDAELEPDSADAPLTLPPSFPADQATFFPWSKPIVFRSGRFLVHQVSVPVNELYHPGATKRTEGK
jgi:hypothetical protein